MNNKNTIQPDIYIYKHILWSVLAMIVYERVFFTALPGKTTAWSRVFLVIFVIVLAAVGILLTFKKYKNNVNVAANILIPYEIYTVIAYFPYIPRMVWIFIIISILIVSALIILSKIKTNKSTKRRTHSFYQNLIASKTAVAFCMIIFLVFLGARVLSGSIIAEPSPIGTSDTADEWTVSNNIDTVLLLQDNEWTKLNNQEKLDVLEVIANIEIQYLGLNHQLHLRSDDLQDGVHAYYKHNKYEIVIDIDNLQNSSAMTLLSDLCHECYHSYQYQMIELYNDTSEEYKNMRLFAVVDEYIENFSNYIDAREDFDGYYAQKVEVSARKYGTSAAQSYDFTIKKYIATEGGQSKQQSDQQ